MNTDVIIKANGHGIRIILNDRYPLNRIIEEIKLKLCKYDAFSGKSGDVRVSFEGRALSREEINKILFEINSLPETGINFVYEDEGECTPKKQVPDIPPHKKRARAPSLANTKAVKRQNEFFGNLFFHGNLTNGQVLETKKSIIIIGNVEKKAKIISNGNIIIIGALRGEAVAGRDCHPKRFVLALKMEPVHIKIGRVGGSLLKPGRKKFNTNDAVIAYCENGQLVFNMLSQTSL